MKKERTEITFISIAKGIGICLVLIGHFIFIPEVRRFIYCFHMPLFFFISGYLFKKRDGSSFWSYVSGKIKSLYVPFIICNLIALPFHNWFCSLGIYDADDRISSFRDAALYIAKIFLCVKMEDVVAPMWFLPILMIVSIAYFVVQLLAGKITEKGSGWIVTAVAAAGVAAAYFLIYKGSASGIYRAVVLVGVSMWVFHLGHMYRKKEAVIKTYAHNGIVLAVCLAAEIALSFFVDINMIQMRFSNPLFFTAGALLGINLVFYVSEKISKYNAGVLRYLGNNSLTVLEWHYWGALITTALQALVYKCGMGGIVDYNGNIRPVWFILYCCTGLGLPLLLLLAKKYTSQMLSKVTGR